MKNLCTCAVSLASLAAGAAATDRVFLSDYLGVPSGGAATAANPPFTTVPTAALPYGFGVDSPGDFATTKIAFLDAGVFEKGIGHHPFEFGQKRIDFNLAAIRVSTTRDLGAFSARVGVDAPTSVQNHGGTFLVLVDGVERAAHFTGGRLSPSVVVAVSVVGASTLSLVTVRGGAFHSNSMCWADAAITLVGGPCAADLNGDRLVDDGDFSIFAPAYNILDCADPAMPVQCPADLNNDSFVDDLDFSIFAVAYDTLLCP